MAVITQKIGTLEYLTAEGISAPHCFTTRLGGVSTGIFGSLNLGMHRGDREKNVKENYARLGALLGFSPENAVLAHQTHSDAIRCVGREDCGRGLSHRNYPECDGLITACPGTALVIFTADCTPILLQDPVTGAVGAVHAGWRGTAADIAGKAVRAMEEQLGCRPENIRAAIGPNIGPCCFQTDRDVPDAMRAALGSQAEAWIRPRYDKYYVNLKELNAAFLRRAGVEQIEISPVCTMCQHDRFWSHRFTGGQRGSQGAIIVCRGEKV